MNMRGRSYRVGRGVAGLRRGVALIDAIIAAVILGVALSAIIGLGNQALNSQRVGEELRTAAMLADEQLNLVLARGPDEYAKRYGTSGECDAPFERFGFDLQFVAGSGGEPYKVTATISWDSSGRDRTIAVEAKISPRLGTDIDPDRRPEAAVERIPAAP